MIKKKCGLSRFYAGGGLNLSQNNSDNFFKYLMNKTDATHPLFIYNTYYIQMGDTSPKKINYDHSSLNMAIFGGVKLNADNFKKRQNYHIVEAGYMKLSGQYSYNVFYSEGDNASAPSWAQIYDTVETKYTNSIISLTYKFQPTFKFVFLSFGINYYLNLIKVNQQKKEQRDDYWYDELNNITYHTYSGSTSSNTTSNIHFMNFPLQIGAGANLKIKNIIIKPAFYFTPCFIKGSNVYNFYNLSLGIGYSVKN